MKRAELKAVQDSIFEIFMEFDRVCSKHNIRYSMEGGTLLGAVKYGDFVPWDDDIDVIMLRSEYDKFLKVAPQELKADFFLQSYHNVPEFPLNYAKLCYTKSKIYNYTYSHIKTMNHGIFMDIFPIDNIQPQNFETQMHWICLLIGARSTKLKMKSRSAPGWKKLCYTVVSWLPLPALNALADKVCTCYNDSSTGYCYEICNPNRNFKPLPESMYTNLTRLKFRGHEFMAVERYDEFLKSRFGKNYLTELPENEKRKPSHCQNIILDTETE